VLAVTLAVTARLSGQPAGAASENVNQSEYAVVGGWRRLAALQLLAEQGRIDASFAVPCQVQDGDDATELSLVETTLREQMHPADEFEAFRNLLDNGTPVEDIAACIRRISQVSAGD
jgi:ParB-like chromosome segregation protein Spo0J